MSRLFAKRMLQKVKAPKVRGLCAKQNPVLTSFLELCFKSVLGVRKELYEIFEVSSFKASLSITPISVLKIVEAMSCASSNECIL